MLEFIYIGTIPVSVCFHDLLELIEVADKYDLPALVSVGKAFAHSRGIPRRFQWAKHLTTLQWAKHLATLQWAKHLATLPLHLRTVWFGQRGRV